MTPAFPGGTDAALAAEKKASRAERQRERAAAAAAAIWAATSDVAEQVATIAHVGSARAHDNVVKWVSLASLEQSERQTRRSRASGDDPLIVELAGSIASVGLLQFPSVRIRSSTPATYELIAGHRRVDALRLLITHGAATIEAAPSLRSALRYQNGDWLIPVVVRTSDHLAAYAQTIAENDHRVDISAWEKALAYDGFRSAMRDAGLSTTIEDVAGALDRKWSTVAPYLRIAERIDADVIMAVGLTADSVDATLGRLSLDALRGVAAPKAVGDRAARLAAAMGVRTAVGTLTASTAADRQDRLARRGTATATPSGVRISIRRSVEELRPKQAARYARQIAPLLLNLINRSAVQLDRSGRDELRSQLEAAITALSRTRAGR